MVSSGPVRLTACLLVLLGTLASCSHAAPQVVQVFSQVNRVFDPETSGWSERLSVFIQASSADGVKVFDRLHLIHEDQGVFFTLGRDQWSQIERPGEFWIGANGLAFPDGKVPTGGWRAQLVTRSGQQVLVTFSVPPPAPGEPKAPTPPVSLKGDPKVPGRYEVTGWVPDFMVWVRDAKGTVTIRSKVTGSVIQVPPASDQFTLYSYDNVRGQGIEAGPFSLKEIPQSADR